MKMKYKNCQGALYKNTHTEYFCVSCRKIYKRVPYVYDAKIDNINLIGYSYKIKIHECLYI